MAERNKTSREKRVMRFKVALAQRFRIISRWNLNGEIRHAWVTWVVMRYPDGYFRGISRSDDGTEDVQGSGGIDTGLLWTS